MNTANTASGRTRKRPTVVESSPAQRYCYRRDDDGDTLGGSKQTNIRSYFSSFKRPRRSAVPETPPSLSDKLAIIESPPSVLQISNDPLTTPPTANEADQQRGDEDYLVDRVEVVQSKDSRLQLAKKPQQKSTNSTSNNLQQMYLDLGQRDFGKQTICKTCGMLFVHGLLEDTKQHKKVCDEFLYGVHFQTKHARVVRQVDKGTKAMIVEIRQSDSYKLRRKLKRILSIVDTDLGFAPSNGSDLGKTAYLFIRGKRVLGIITVQVISEAYALSSMSERSNDKRPAMVGIHKMWVLRTMRNQGIASLLVDTVRTKLIYGIHVPSNMVAFSSPTEAGARFAKSYLAAAGPVLVYDCI